MTDGRPVPGVPQVMRLARRFGIELVRRYHRQSVQVDAPLPDGPAVIVGNHGFGGVVDLNVFSLLSAVEPLAAERPIILLTHQLAWTLRLGRLLETVGARPASRDVALAALADGHLVVVFPGGDLEASKSWRDRDRVKFFGRSGFARLALEADVPIVPVVTAGAGESLLVLSDGQRLASAVQLHRLLRYRALPVSLSVPWGFNVGLVGLAPYLPLPTKLDTRVLASMQAEPDEPAEQYAARVAEQMQRALDQLTAGRRYLLG
jgi:1-acyl-sn-glycerol-3-phosphate acyltransferase